MDPAVRKQWAQTWARWLQPGGQLVTLMFPVEPEGREGPPWPVPLELYQELLPPQGTHKRFADVCMFPVELEGREGPLWHVPLALYNQLLPPQGHDKHSADK